MLSLPLSLSLSLSLLLMVATGLTEYIISQTLDAQNTYRGMVDPPATNMLRLVSQRIAQPVSVSMFTQTIFSITNVTQLHVNFGGVSTN